MLNTNKDITTETGPFFSGVLGKKEMWSIIVTGPSGDYSASNRPRNVKIVYEADIEITSRHEYPLNCTTRGPITN